MDNVMDRIEAIRKRRGMSQIDICRAISVDKQAYSDWKHGRSKSYEKKLPQIAEALNCTVEYLTKGAESPAEDFYRQYTQLPETVQQAIKLLMQTEYKK